MSNPFKTPKPQGPTKQQKELERQQLEEKKQQESELAERQAMRKKKAQGRSSLLTGTATGVQGQPTQTTVG